MSKIALKVGKVTIKLIPFILLLGAIFFIVKSTTTGAFADPSVELEQARLYQQKGQYSQAEQIYQDIIQQKPGIDYAFEAQKNLTVLYILWGRAAEAQTAYQQLLDEFSQHPDLRKALHSIATEYEWSRFELSIRYETAKEVYQQLIDRYPNSWDSTLGELHIEKLKIWSFIEAADHLAAQAAIEACIANTAFCEHSDFPAVLHTIAVRYEWSQFNWSIRYEVIKSLYELVIQKYPDNWVVPTAKLNLAKMNVLSLIVELADEADVQAAIDNLIVDFSDHPDLPKALHSIATQYEWSGFPPSTRYQAANDLYQQIIELSPESWCAARSELNIRKIEIWSLIESVADEAAIQDAIDSLIADFNDHSDLPVALHAIAIKYQEEYQEERKYTKAKSICELIIQQYPDSWVVDMAQLDIPKINILSLIGAGDYAAAEEEIDNLLADYPEHSRLPEALHSIASWYERSKKYPEATDIYQQLIEQYPASWQSDIARLSIPKMDIISLIVSGEDNTAQVVIDELIADFNDSPGLVKAIYQIAGEYYDVACRQQNKGDVEQAKENFNKAIDVCQRATEELAPCATTADVCHLAGSCYWQLGEYETALQHLSRSVNNWPNYEYDWHVRFLIGYCYEGLRRTGILPTAEANAQIEQAYRVLVEKYPDCPSVKHALSRLGQISFWRSDWPGVINYFGRYLQKALGTQPPAYMMYYLGRAYDETSQPDLAVYFYTNFTQTAEPNDPSMETVLARLEKLAERPAK